MKHKIKNDKSSLLLLLLGATAFVSHVSLAADDPKVPPTKQVQAQQSASSPATNNPARRPREKSFPQIESGKWTGPKLEDGQPDISGHVECQSK